MNKCFIGDCRDSMRKLIDDGVRVQTCVTSPPYWGLRDYGVAGQLGLEPTIEEYLLNMVEVFRVVRELLANDGTLWLNLGDSYAGSGRGGYAGDKSSLDGSTTGQDNSRSARSLQIKAGFHEEQVQSGAIGRAWVKPTDGLKRKDLCGIPWRVAFALQQDGWWLRQDIIWYKKNTMPESVTDRCTKAHEYIFLLAKAEKYYFDADAIAEPIASSSLSRLQQNIDDQAGSNRVPGKTNGAMKAVAKGNRKTFRGGGVYTNNRSFDNNGASGNDSVGNEPNATGLRNKRSVWHVATQPYSEAHFATFPPALIEPCILAGSRPGDIVLDPFFGSGTTGQVAQALGRQWIGCELNPEYEKLQLARTAQSGMPL